MINTRSLSRGYDNDVRLLRKQAEAPGRLGNEPPLESTRPVVPIHVFAERGDLQAAAVRMLSELGFVIDSPIVISAADLEHGLVLIVGDHFQTDFLTNVLTGPWTAHLEHVVVFGNRIGGRTLAALGEIGFPYIVKSLPTTENLAGIVAAAIPGAINASQSVIARRLAANSAIETGSNRLFEHIRAGNLNAAVDEARNAFNHFETLLDSAAASHWLSMIQQYHNGTAQHCSLVSAVAMLFARSLGFSEGDQRRLFEAAHFHDVGKVHIPLAILDKPGALDFSERETMETHAQAGYNILIRSETIASEYAEAARDHHEYLDGTGYPRGIRSRQISDITRIITICDIFAALIERRAYKQPKTAREAYSILQSLGDKLDPPLLRAFSKIAESCSSD